MNLLAKLVALIKKLLMPGDRLPPPSAKFDWLMTAVAAWFMAGVYLDGWAHNHLDSALETFFTPWHAVMYSGFAACGLTLLVALLMNRRRGYAWRSSLPDGYTASFVGAGIFTFGGAFDVFWHLTFGIEKDIEALLSPAHLILAIGGFLIVSGPFRAAWRRERAPEGFIDFLPAILSMTFMLSIVSFMTQFAHPVRHLASGFAPPGDVADLQQGRAAAGFILQIGLLTGLTLLAVRRWGRSVPYATFAVLFGLNMYGMANMTDEYRLVWAAVLAGLLADNELRRLAPTVAEPKNLRIFATAVPAAYAALVFLVLLFTERVWWSVHMWSGVIVLCGIVGLFLSYLVAPPSSKTA